MNIHTDGDRLVFDLILNIGLLVIVAQLLSKLKMVQSMLVQERRTWRHQLILSLLFAATIILSTFTSIDFGGYNLNTRVIGAMAAGLLGGPLVGMYASFLGAIYVYIFSTPKIFASAAAFSTVLFGLLGGSFYPYFQRGKWKYRDLFLLACFAEICDMVSLLRLSPEMWKAFETILQISFPMIVLNSCGILLFISTFNNVFIQQDLESSRQLQRASELSRKCLPLLYKGLHKGERINQLASVILRETDWSGVMITNRSEILEWRFKKPEPYGEPKRGVPDIRNCQVPEGRKGLLGSLNQTHNPESLPEDLSDILGRMTEIPEIGEKAMDTRELVTVHQISKNNKDYERMKEYSLIAAPFVIRDQSIGCMIVWIKKQWVIRQSETELLQNLVTIGSTQIAMAELDHQKRMRQKAEFKTLQFQVNPHFLFNALNTIAYVCRENPDRARELLVILANYFRYNLNSENYMVSMREELDHVKDYLELEKARFEDKLTVTYDVPTQMDMRIPTLIFQPIVENAVRYGADQTGRRRVAIQIRDREKEVIVRICDAGKGFPAEILEKLKNGEPTGKSIGLTNVHRRMKSIYGEDNGLVIVSSEKGSTVELHFLKEMPKEGEDENRNN